MRGLDELLRLEKERGGDERGEKTRGRERRMS
jgi:hypothetical protein